MSQRTLDGRSSKRKLSKKEFRMWFKRWKAGIVSFDQLPEEVKKWIVRTFGKK